MPDFDSFNQSFAMMQGLVVVFFIAVVVMIVVGVVNRARVAARDNAAPEVSAAARVLDRRIETTGGGDTTVSQRYFVSFEQPSGERFELEVPESEYGLLAVGDNGTVAMKGTRYLGFAREIMR
nr:DUF2500 domain-containing protein [Propionicimonas sp.]